MIEELYIRNCQSHKDSLIKFHPGLNVIIGDTDSGKSAIIRGLDKGIYNSMPSKELISHWGGPLVISLKVDDNKITLKNDGKDSYQLNDISFSAIGSKVPEEISQIFNMSDINIQNQIDSFFLLTETSGYVASYLNQIANLSQIDSTTKSIKSELNETKRTIEHDKKSLSEKEKTLESYSFLVPLLTALKEADGLEFKLMNTEIEIESIEIFINRIKEINLKLLENKKILSLKPLVESSLNLINDISKLEIDLKKLKGLSNSFQTLEFELKKLNKLSHLKPLIDDALELKNKESDLKAKLDTLDAFIDKVSIVDKELKTAISNRTKEHNKYHSELQKLDKCFFCGSKLNKN